MEKHWGKYAQKITDSKRKFFISSHENISLLLKYETSCFKIDLSNILMMGKIFKINQHNSKFKKNVLFPWNLICWHCLQDIKNFKIIKTAACICAEYYLCLIKLGKQQISDYFHVCINQTDVIYKICLIIDYILGFTNGQAKKHSKKGVIYQYFFTE